jgi:hypothetical protein
MSLAPKPKASRSMPAVLPNTLPTADPGHAVEADIDERVLDIRADLEYPQVQVAAVAACEHIVDELQDDAAAVTKGDVGTIHCVVQLIAPA